MYRVRTLLLATLILTVWTMPAHAQEPPPSPEQWMTRGAGVLPQGRHGFLFSAGLPSLEARFILPVNAYMEVNPVVRFGYVVGTSMVFNPSITAGAELKFNVFNGAATVATPSALARIRLTTSSQWSTIRTLFFEQPR